nr:EOG090X0DUK [Eurycercus lamellatus]
MESPRISCWTFRAALLLTFLLAIHYQQEKAVDAAPLFEDYEGNRVEQPSLYELLLQRELMTDRLDADGRGHMMVRKSDRSPSLRRSYSKGKERGEKSKKKSAAIVNEAEIAELVNVERLKEDLQKSLEQLKADYVKNLTIRSATGSIESLPVEFEGEKYTLQEIAQIGRKGPQLLVVNVSSFPQAIKNILKAIDESGMGLNPQQDGTTIFIPVPKVTREYRESLAKNAKVLFQKFKDHSRDIQNRYIRDVKKKEKAVSADLVFSVQQQIHTIAEQVVLEGEKIMIAKQNELLS